MFDKKTEEIASLIGEFYLRKHNYNYVKAEDEIVKCGFMRVEPIGDRVIIEVRRPGWFIGKRGENVQKLETFLGMKIHIKEHPRHIEDLIIPQQEEPLDDLLCQDILPNLERK